jgi:hypothetical protein
LGAKGARQRVQQKIMTRRITQEERFTDGSHITENGFVNSNEEDP